MVRFPKPYYSFLFFLFLNLGRFQEDYDTFYCVVDLHAITAPHNPKELSDATLSAAAVR
jgi:tryptophanyl-tRNA synthetase